MKKIISFLLVVLAVSNSLCVSNLDAKNFLEPDYGISLCNGRDDIGEPNVE